jgi:aspartate/methionine/tyrosine aminotransferase
MRNQPSRIARLELQNRVPGNSARRADLQLLAKAPDAYLDTTHFDTVRFPPPSWAHETFARAAKDGSLAYTPYRGNTAVLETLGHSLSEFLGVDVDPQQHIALTPGTQAALFGTLAALVEKGERIALTDPDYLFNARILEFLGADIGYVPLRDSSTAPSLDLDALEDEFSSKHARIFLFSHPNNPTGYVYPIEVLEKIAELVLRYDVTVVVDALYSRLIHKPHVYAHFVSFPNMQNRVVTLMGPSKTESLSGYRLGVVVGPSWLMPRLENVLSITSLRAPAYAQHLLSVWLREDQKWLAELLPQFTALRKMTVDRFRQLPWLKVEPQAGTAYVWPDVSALGASDVEVSQALMKDAAVLVSPGYQFGIQGDGHFRVCYARDERQWSAALDRMLDALNRLADKQGLTGAA